jgi:hypothetical protein
MPNASETWQFPMAFDLVPAMGCRFVGAPHCIPAIRDKGKERSTGIYVKDYPNELRLSA